MFLLTVGFFSLAFTNLLAETPLFNRWTVKLSITDTALERHMTADLAGLVVDGDSFYIATPGRFLEKRHLTTGEKIWTLKLDGESQTSWTLVAGVLYGGDARGNLYAVKAEDGSVKWRIQTKGVFFSRPLVGEKQIWVNTSQGLLQSFDRETGAWLWQQADPKASSLSLWSYQGPVKFQDQVVSGFPSSLLQAFDPVTGALSWKESFSVSVTDGPESFNDLKSVTSVDELLIASSYGGDMKVWSAKNHSKKLLWSKKLSLYAPVTVEGDVVYLSARDGSVQAIDVHSGYIKWRYDLPRGLATQPAVKADRVWVGSTAGEVYVFSTSGVLISRSTNLEAPIWTPPVLISPNDALVSSSSAILRRYHLSN